jgi:putative ABC transport system ATP-binding protein
MAGRRTHAPDQLSGGEQQRVAVARALVVEPAVILADEPTGSLDSRTAEGILELLSRAAREHGRTVVMVTHDHEAAAHAGRIIHVVDGRVDHVVDGRVEPVRQGASAPARTRASA